MAYMKILIGVPKQEFSRYSDFTDVLNALQHPEGAEIMQISARNQSPAKNRNNIIKAALENKCTHILFIDDDMAFPQDSLIRLVNHDVDVVTGLYLHRTYPYQPLVFDARDNDGKCQYASLEGRSGLQEIANCGFGFVLIKIEVFKDWPEPWVTLGGIEKDEWCDDIVFFNEVRERGFKIYCDFDVWCGHMARMTVWPNKIGDQWMFSLADCQGAGINVPAIHREAVIKSEF